MTPRRFQGRWTDLPRLARVALALVAALSLAELALVAVAVSRSGLEAPAATLLVRDSEGRFLGELPAAADDQLGFWSVEEIPERVVAATLAIEDRRFAWHPGVDPLAIVRAFAQNARSDRRISGASTLAMQIARLQEPGRRGYLRKALEATTALVLTARHGREELLRHYLRIVPYGHRIHGIAYAARRYLDKPVADLSWAEIAFLAAIPQSPARMDPYDPAGRSRAERRGRTILARLAAHGELPPVELAAAEEEIGRLALPWRAERPEAALHALLHFGALASAEERARRPLVTATLDLELQREVEWLALRSVAEMEERGAGNAAVMVVDRASWSVVAAVSSTGYFDGERAGAIDYLRLPRSPGSALKPFLFARALDRGAIHTRTVLDDLEPGPSGILNSDGRFLGPMLPRVALGNSRNVPAVALVARLGLEDAYGFLGELGLHEHELGARRFGLGIAIGALPVTLESLVAAYTTLAGDGRLMEPAWIAGRPAVAGRRLFSADVARLLTLFLADPQARLPTFPRMGFAEYPYAVAVKTGTSSRYRDAWTVAWSRRYLVGVWLGHPDERPMSALSGYRVAARLAQQVMERLHGRESDGLEGVEFPAPAGFVQRQLCAISGAQATSACERVALEWVRENESVELCSVHRRSGGRVRVELPPRYAGWLARERASGAAERASPHDANRSEETPRFADLSRTKIQITSPQVGARLLRDPETPAEETTLALRVQVEPAVEQLVWYVDGEPFATVDAPFEARWPLVPGDHSFQARVPFTAARSPAVRVRVD